ncbi:FtsK/SpoIIIE domain-containing protein [Frankia canadensis]|uniref:FtsK/SpoIIIE domain-containing protein n=1 Tax=Frankia canadensis TaxID=1836972 RepID=UPI001FAEF11E|nr:FtsK/SpoIIIE domain-containing protein [Frankia canadensis]
MLLDASQARRSSSAGLLDLAIVTGVGAGVVHPLPAGEHRVGVSPGGVITLGGGLPRPPLLTVRVAVDGTFDLIPGTGTRVISRPPAMPQGTIVALVGTPPATLRFTRPAVQAARAQLPAPRFNVNRPPRIRPTPSATAFTLPVPPTRPRSMPVPVLATLLPVLAAGGMAMILGSASLLLFAAVGPLTLGASVLSTRRRDRSSHRSDQARHERTCLAVERAARQALRREQRERHTDHPDPAALFAIAWQRDAGLWRRRPEDADYLRLRVGTAEQPSTVAVSTAARAASPLRACFPAVIDLPEHGVAGVAIPAGGASELGSWLVAQAVVLHSPAELAVRVLVAEPRDADAWRWLRWLPHCRYESADARLVSFAAGEVGCAAQVAELLSLIDGRREQGSRGIARGRDVLVVIEGARALRAVPGMIALLRTGPELGVHIVCLETAVRNLPVECRTVVDADGEYLTLRRDQGSTVRRVRPDLVGPAGRRRSLTGLAGTSRWCESVARALAPLRDISEDTGLPGSVRLSELLAPYGTTATAIAARWASAGSPGPATGGRPVPVGIAGGAVFALNLQADGPHGLIAGTTGAGKSELLQTIIAAHAVAYRPDELTFVLVDYKGGSAFAECAGLPHTLGLVTDLDPHLVRRALTSLSAELRQREGLLARYGARDLESLSRLPPGQRPAATPPRLVLVVDEFATLARELPDFVSGLVGLAQRGRSLGLHLLLATQRPSGVVSPEIRANTNLRVALRVTDIAESEDVVGSPDAALIDPSTPGRAVVRCGPDRVTVVQTGWASAPSPDDLVTPAGLEVTRLPWPDLRPLVDAAEPEATSYAPTTELTALVHSVREAAACLRIGSQPSPWLPPLPERLSLSALPPVPPLSAAAVHAVRPVTIGLVDDCDRQRQDPFTVDLEHGGHLLVVGAARSGRSTALRAVAGAVAGALSPRDVHLYGLDCGGGALAAITALPHTGALVGRDDPERVGRLLARLIAVVDQRRRRFAVDGVADLLEARRSAGPGAALPYLLLLLDGFEGFLAEFEDLNGGDLVEDLMRLLREGLGAGLRVILSTDRRGLTGRLTSLVDERLILRMADPADYALAGITAATLPGHLPAGRALATGGRFATPVEVQVGLLDGEPAGRSQAAALRSLGARASVLAPATVPASGGMRPFRVEALPTRVTAAEMAAALRDRPAPLLSTGLRVPLGLGGDDLSPVEIDLSDDTGFVVGGPPRSGRSSTLVTISLALLRQGMALVAVTPRACALRNLIDHRNMVVVLDAGLSPLSGHATQNRPNPPEQLHPVTRLLWPGAGADGTPSIDAAGRAPVVLVDDAELVGEPAASALADYWRRARDLGGILIIAGSTEDLLLQYRGFTVDVRREEHGLLLAPRRVTDGDLLGTRLPRPGSGPVPPGRGVLVRRGRLRPVQVARPPSPSPTAAPNHNREPTRHENGHHSGSHASRLPDGSAAA